jgi:hypothetical protein
VQYDPSSRELQLTGYIGGNVPMNVNQLIQIPHLGTFPVKDVRLAGVPSRLEKGGGGGANMVLLPPIIAASRKKTRGIKIVNNESYDATEMVLAISNIKKRESVEMFALLMHSRENKISLDLMKMMIDKIMTRLKTILTNLRHLLVTRPSTCWVV